MKQKNRFLIAKEYKTYEQFTKLVFPTIHQVVWGETSEIGCGRVHYQCEHSNIDFPQCKIYTCNYGKAGNLLTAPVYSAGNAASACTNGVSQNYPGLCN